MNTEKKLYQAINIVKGLNPHVKLVLEEKNKSSYNDCKNIIKVTQENNFLELFKHSEEGQLLTKYINGCQSLSKVIDLAENQKLLLNKLEMCSAIQRFHSDTSYSYKSLCHDVTEVAGDFPTQFLQAYNDFISY